MAITLLGLWLFQTTPPATGAVVLDYVFPVNSGARRRRGST